MLLKSNYICYEFMVDYNGHHILLFIYIYVLIIKVNYFVLFSCNIKVIWSNMTFSSRSQLLHLQNRAVLRFCKWNFCLRAISQLTHNVFTTLLESFTELGWDKRCSNVVATFDQIYFEWQCRWHEFAIERGHCIQGKLCKNMWNIQLRWVFLILKMSNIKRCYNVAATLC